MSRVQLSKVLNRNLQTKKTRKYTQSLSLLAEEQMRKDLLDELQAQKNGGIDKNQQKAIDLKIQQPNYLTKDDIDRYLIKPIYIEPREVEGSDKSNCSHRAKTSHDIKSKYEITDPYKFYERRLA